MMPAGGPEGTPERDTLPPIDPLHPQHEAYARAMVAKYAITPTYHREDLVQEILFQAHRSRRSPLEPRALLFGITRHVAYRWMAEYRQERAAIAAIKGEDKMDDGCAPSPEEERIATERAALVHAAIAQMPPAYRDVFVQVELRGLSMPEVAKELGLEHVNTGYTRLHLAREAFDKLVRRLMTERNLTKEDL